MKDEIPLNEIRLFSRRPDEVGFETLISTIERLLEMALSRVNEQEGGEDYRRGLLLAALAGPKEPLIAEAPPVPMAPVEPESPPKPAPPKPKDSHNPPSKSPGKVT